MFGPDAFRGVGFVLWFGAISMVVCAVAAIAGAIWGVLWLIEHMRFV